MKCICLISSTKNGETINGAGFFCEIHDPDDDNKVLNVLFTCNHVLKINNEDDIRNIDKIEIQFNGIEKIPLNLNNRRIWYDIENKENNSENLDYTCIEINKEEIKDNKIQLLTIEQNIMQNYTQISYYKKKRQTIYICKKEKEQIRLSFDKAKINDDKNEKYFYYECNSVDGLSGVPILNKRNNVIGIHIKGEDNNSNIGIFIQNVLKDMKKKSH